MSDPKVVKRNLLHDLLQRARSSTHSSSKGPKFLSTSNSSLRGSRSSLKSPSGLESPKVRTSRSTKKLHLPSVFRSRKEVSPSPEDKKSEKSDSTKRRHSLYSEAFPLLKSSPFVKRKADDEKKQLKLAEKVLKEVVDKHGAKHKKLIKSPNKEPTPKHVLYTTFEENNLNNLLHGNDTVTVIPWKTDKQIPVSPGQKLKKVSICTSCGHVGDKEEVPQTITITPSDNQKETETPSGENAKSVEKNLKDTKSVATNDKKISIPPLGEPTKTLPEQNKIVETPSNRDTEKSSPKLLTKPPLFRSNSDPISPTQLDASRRILQQQKQQIREAKITHTKSLRKPLRRRHTDTVFYSVNDVKNITDHREDRIMMPKTRNSVSDIYPLLKTKIPEEQIQNDGSVTFRKTRNVEDKHADRDSGVDVDNKMQQVNSKDSDYDIDNERSQSDESISKSNDDITDDDTLKKSKHSVSSEGQNKEVQSSDNDTLTRKSKKSEEDADNKKWDMYALLRRFECVEWDLFPASNLKRQTLDLDNCNLSCVPAAVTEIEYYAFRDVEAVSLNHNQNVTNADVLGKLADLRVINMWGCNLKAIPQTWSRLTKLQMLGLGNNTELTEFGPLKHLTNLTWLDLGGCGLKKIPDEVTNMMKLRVLALGCNPGIEVGDEICSLWDLKKLGLNDCALLEIPKPVFCLIKITHLHLDNNFIKAIDQEIVQLKDLQELTVTGNDDIAFPKLLSQCDTIQSIVVDVGKDLSRMSGTLKNRIRHLPASVSPIKEYTQRRVSCI